MERARDDYEIRQANRDDIPAIMAYIGEDWKQGHILSTNRVLFEHMFLEPDGKVNVVIAINRSKSRIDGCEAFLKASLNTEDYDVWGGMWKVRKEARPLLGTDILQYRRSLPGIRHCLGIGLNPNTAVKIHGRFLKESIDKMKHWYCLADRAEYKLAFVGHRDAPIPLPDDGIKAKPLDASAFAAAFGRMPQDTSAVPYKDKAYFLHRYYAHPIYVYQAYGIYHKDVIKAVFFAREDCHEGRIAVRIVDYYGDESFLYGIGKYMPEFFAKESVEYVDFYEYGFSDDNFRKAGFCLLEENDTNVVPNYFHPFVRENIDIWITFLVDGAKFVKGDGDMDRPN